MKPGDSSKYHDDSAIEAERLAQLALDHTAEATELERRVLNGQASLRSEVEEWGTFVAKQRGLFDSALADEQGERGASALSERILMATTRRKPSWIGDLRLIKDLVLSRCQQSLWVRLAAASLLLHLAALPVLAWFLIREPVPEPMIFFALPTAQEFEPQPVELIDVDALDPQILLDEEPVGMFAPDATQNARRRARFVLHTHGAPVAKGLLSSSGVTRLLAARSKGINEQNWTSLPDLSSLKGSQLEIALLAEAWLDRAILEGDSIESDEPLRSILGDLHPNISGETAIDLLVRSAVGRALELGLADEALRAAWRTDLWYESSDSEPSKRGGRPLTDEWFTQLKQATEGYANEPILSVWLDWSAR
ncbi:MAG: hypothetical protein ACI8TQ_001224 [Planctomycetota bacterium]|jgi:hypothetical protein